MVKGTEEVGSKGMGEVEAKGLVGPVTGEGGVVGGTEMMVGSDHTSNIRQTASLVSSVRHPFASVCALPRGSHVLLTRGSHVLLTQRKKKKGETTTLMNPSYSVPVQCSYYP